MKPCKFGCGTDVTYVLLSEAEDGKKTWTPPMESVYRSVVRNRTTDAFAFADVTVQQRFALHACEAKRVEDARRLKASQEREARSRTTEAAWDEALKRSCPKCDEAPGVRCANLTSRRREVNETTRWPHEARLPHGWMEDVVRQGGVSNGD